MTIPSPKILSSIKASLPTTLRSSRAPPKEPTTTPSRLTADDRTLKVAHNMIQQEPEQVDGYLLAGKLYEKQHRYSAARTTYADAMAHVSPTHEHYDELQRALKRLDMQRGSFIHIFPYYVSCMIFNHLGTDDLIQCIDVSLWWNDFILQQPQFWNQLADSLDPATAHSYGKDDRLRIWPKHWNHFSWTPTDTLIMSMLRFIRDVGTTSNIRELHIQNMGLKFDEIDLIVETVQSCNANIECLVFEHVQIGGPEYVLVGLLGRCPQLKHCSIHLANSSVHWDDRKPFMVPGIGYQTVYDGFPYDTYMLTTLELSLNVGRILPDLVPKLFLNFIKRCPWLEILRVDTNNNLAYGQIIRAATKHCHYLKDLVMNTHCELPSVLRNRHFNVDKSKTKGLQRFVLSRIDNANATSSDILQLFKKHHTTLTVVYLGLHDQIIDDWFLIRMSRYELTQLRELYLHNDAKSDFPSTGIHKYIGRLTFNQVIVALAHCCPSLRIFHVVENEAVWGIEGSDPITYDAVLSLVKHCRFLVEVKIDTLLTKVVQRDFTSKGLKALKDRLKFVLML